MLSDLILDLLSTPELVALEDAIAARTSSKVLRDDLQMNAHFLVADVSAAGVAFDQVARALCDRTRDILELGVRIIRAEEAERAKVGGVDLGEFPPGEEVHDEADDATGNVEVLGYSAGFSLLFATYFYFLQRGDRKGLLESLKRRRVAHAKKFASSLEQVFSELSAQES